MNEPPVKPRTIVVVDDQAEFLHIARVQLTRNGCLKVVGEAMSGAAALELVSNLAPRPDGVLLDVEMPGQDGLQTARLIRTLAPEVRIIVTSASNTPGYRAAAVRIGAAFLPKRSLTAEAVLDLLD
jgi:CheY-like chemotaxis protein